ncbi:MAG: thiamine phosphate synthase [Holophagales bacterium]|nr:thiamine phosphate synthase [Holophagales bacterium]MYG30777.1 thiamine phosphate synthase [Holophagales bacterium]MYI81717.1 thiamine phosphate synthase [Holophagales bacterium]
MTARRPVLRPPANRLYAIVDTGFFGSEPVTVTGAVRTLLDCGARWIQVRAKGLPDLAAWRLADAVGPVFEEASVADGDDDAPLLWINDNAAIAAALLASDPRAGLRVGLHLGQDDLPSAAARLSIPSACPIGRSTHGRAQAVEADGDPAVDALAIGPVFGTTTKERPDPVIGLAGVAQAREVTSKPLIGIGGIDADRAPRVIEAGADAVAVVSALEPADLAASCRRLLRALA